MEDTEVIQMSEEMFPESGPSEMVLPVPEEDSHAALESQDLTNGKLDGDSKTDSNALEDSELINGELVNGDKNDSNVLAESEPMDVASELLTEDSPIQDTPVIDSEIVDLENGNEGDVDDDTEQEKENESSKLCQLPLSKIKRIMRTAVAEDTEVKILSKDSIFLVEQATELFIAALAQEAARVTSAQKKKTITIQHLASSVKDTETFSFLEGTLVPDYDI